MKFIHQIKIYFILSLFLGIISISAFSQTYLYFQDSPDPDFYDFSWMVEESPSELERKVEPDLRKFPVESIITAKQGINSLRLKWKSLTDGNWFAIAAGQGWTAHNISDTDTLLFWLQSIEGISNLDLPLVFMEDVTNKKSSFHSITDWTDDLVAGVWTRIAMPMSLFLTSGDGLDYTKIKTIGFTQNLDDGIEHTLLIDDMRVIKGDGTSPPVSIPQGLSATAYEYHIELSWDLNPETYLAGYQIERSLDGGFIYSTIQQVDKNTHSYIDWVKPLGASLEASYRIKALNEALEPSEPSSVVSATTFSMTNDEYLDMVQKYTFRYFWEGAHEASGMARERNTSANTVTSGGSGFGIMTIPVAIERGFITRDQGIERVLKILNFLKTADRFHGAWSHWINGNTGKVIPFSTKDNGGDLVETSFMAQGLLTIRQYFNGGSADEQQIVQLATELWEGIEWDWYRRNGSNALYWHWSPEYNWDMNMQVKGYNEAAITYLMAIASPTHGIPASLWDIGWAGASYYLNGKSFYGYKIFVGWDYGGPLFFTHYSFLGFDPRDKADKYTNYFDNSRNISLIHQAYAAANPKAFTGYSASCWGLTASDDPDGYLAHEPNSNRDNGTISPTAALSAFPYTPEESMLALKHFYKELGDKTWGLMGFYDAFNQTRNWYATSYLAIDQGPIVIMIENYRTQLLWNLFMADPDAQAMTEAIGFISAPNSVDEKAGREEFIAYPNPSAHGFSINYSLCTLSKVQIDVFNLAGIRVMSLINNKLTEPGDYTVNIADKALQQGVYLLKLNIQNEESRMIKLIVE